MSPKQAAILAESKAPRYAVRLAGGVVQVIGPDGEVVAQDELAAGETVVAEAERWAKALNRAAHLAYEAGQKKVIDAIAKGGRN